SSDATGSTVSGAKRSTSTNVTCSPSTVPINDGSTCTTTVSDTDTGTKSAPGGTVTLSHTGSGSFDSATCSLAQDGTTTHSSCSVTYTPSAAGSSPITARFPYTTLFRSSSDATGSTVSGAKRSTSTNVTCSPSTVPINDGST